MQAQQLLKCAFYLIKTHGFTRQTLSLAAQSLPKPHTEPLPDTAVTALFGSGMDARRTLLCAWLEEGRQNMADSKERTVNALLKHRLRWNVPVLQYLPEAFAILNSPSSGVPPLDLMRATQHAASIADQVCHLSGDKGTGHAWYAKRIELTAVYTFTELLQMKSPDNAEDFLDELLQSVYGTDSALQDTAEFARHAGRSWLGILHSAGLI